MSSSIISAFYCRSIKLSKILIKMKYLKFERTHVETYMIKWFHRILQDIILSIELFKGCLIKRFIWIMESWSLIFLEKGRKGIVKEALIGLYPLLHYAHLKFVVNLQIRASAYSCSSMPYHNLGLHIYHVIWLSIEAYYWSNNQVMD